LARCGGNFSVANGISENGTVAGWATDTVGKQAVIWDQTGIVDPGEPPACDPADFSQADLDDDADVDLNDFPTFGLNFTG
jgi:hypothetical protein